MFIKSADTSVAASWGRMWMGRRRSLRSVKSGALVETKKNIDGDAALYGA